MAEFAQPPPSNHDDAPAAAVRPSRRPLIGRSLGFGLSVAAVGFLIGFITSWPFIRFSQLDWAETVVLLTANWLPWLVISLVVMTLVRWFPLDPDNWKRALPFHIAACLALSIGLDNLSTYVVRQTLSRLAPGNFVHGPAAERGDGWMGPGGPRMMSTERRLPPMPTADLAPSALAPASDSRRADGTPPPPGGPAREWGTQTVHSFGPNDRAEGAFGGRFGRFNPREESPNFLLLAMMSLRGFIIFVIYVVLVAAIQAIRNHHRAIAQAQQATEARAQLVSARLQALQTQIQPHFLFNTLNAVTEFIHDQPNVAEEMLCSLSNLLRQILTLSDRHEMPLADELELVELYLSIQRHRFADRLQFAQDIESGLETAAVPPLILQPLIENAVVHGIGKRRQPSLVRLQVMRIHTQLRLSLTERPVDLHAAPGPGSSVPATHGIGLENTRVRLQTLYGEAASLHAGPQANGVYYTEVNIPLRFLSPAPCEL